MISEVDIFLFLGIIGFSILHFGIRGEGEMTKQLSEVRMKVLLRLLDFVNPLPNMQYAVLKSFWKNRQFPMVFSELFLVTSDPFQTPPRNLRVLLSWRDDADYPRSFHVPGGMIVPGEEIRSAAERITQKEFGVGVRDSWTVCPLNNRNHKRSPEYSPVLICRLDHEPDLKSHNVVFAPLGALPENCIPYQKALAGRGLNWLYVMQSLSVEDRNRVLEVTDVFEYPFEE